MHQELIDQIAGEQTLKPFQVYNVVHLLFEEDCTVPFISRYRKEKTGSLDEVAIRTIRDQYVSLTELKDRKEKVFHMVKEKLEANPELAKNYPGILKKIMSAPTKVALEDLYQPFKTKRKTKGTEAREKGLGALLDELLGSLKDRSIHLQDVVDGFMKKKTVDPSIETVDDALEGVRDILSEQIGEQPEIKTRVRQIFESTAFLVCEKAEVKASPSGAKKLTEKKKKRGQDHYKAYYQFRSKWDRVASFAILAMRRGESEKELRLAFEINKDEVYEAVAATFWECSPFDPINPEIKAWMEKVSSFATDKFILPHLETEFRLLLKRRAEEDSIGVFASNLGDLLMQPPVPPGNVMGVDPGIRTGSKLAVVDASGKYLDSATIQLGFDGKSNNDEAQKKVEEFVEKYQPTYIAVGNGTAGREAFKMIKEWVAKRPLKCLFVNEAGASVYSTDDVAREEFPDLDATIRSAISIARRLQDPLSELVKIDPRSVGVGQYQHDINVSKLKKSLGETVESCVNRVGVNLYTASAPLLSYVSGVGPALATNIVKHRESQGVIPSRQSLLEIEGFGPKAFQQASGFLRFPDSTQPLDKTGVHPDHYSVVEKMAASLAVSVEELLADPKKMDQIALEDFVTDEIGLPTLIDIQQELKKPGRDPREKGISIEYSDDVFDFSELKNDMIVQGMVTNVTDFGAFVDFGVHQDGLIHKSELANRFVKDPKEVVRVGDRIRAQIIDVDHDRKKIALSLKRLHQKTDQPRGKDTRDFRRGKGGASQRGQPPHKGPNKGPHKGGQSRNFRSGSGKKPAPSHFTMDDLLKKFNG